MDKLAELGIGLIAGIIGAIQKAKEAGDERALAAAYLELSDLLVKGALSADARAVAHAKASADADKALADKFDGGA